ncbi:MAG: DUF1028 domain-containing protein [Acidobacteriota bacterium]|nr:DUF1028 domain-containing protein [Acidobacteriota bacterium]
MKTLILVLTLLLVPALPASATFSIVAIDPVTGDLGIAVASRYFAVGAVVPWADAGVGAVATQAGVNVGYGPRALELLRQGLTAQQVIDRLFQEDTFPGKDGRQIAIVDAKGNVAVFTGDAANAWRGHVTGKTWSAQGNILVGQHVVEAMGRAFDRTNDELAEKLYAALKAGDDAGGDSRGRQSAAILVVRKAGGRNTNNDRYVFVNVDDHQDPMGELRRLMNIQMTINHGGAVTRAITANDFAKALASAEKLAGYSPNDAATHVRSGFIAYLAGNRDRATAAFARAKQLTLPAQFKALWEGQSSRTPAFARVLEDKAFVAASGPQ